MSKDVQKPCNNCNNSWEKKKLKKKEFQTRIFLFRLSVLGKNYFDAQKLMEDENLEREKS